MKVFFGGAEKGSYRNMLIKEDVKRYGFNLTHLPIPKKKELDLRTLFNNGEVLLYSSENDEDDARYDQFLRDHADELDIVIGRPQYDGSWLNEKYVPIWNDPKDLERFAWLCQKHGRVAVSDKAIDGSNISRINSLSQRWGAQLIGITSKPDLIEKINWEAVVVGSWTSVIRYGETQIWDGHGLRRYPAQQKETARKRHRADILRLGIDFDAVMDDDVSALGSLAIASWQQWEGATFGGYDPSEDDDEIEFNTAEKGSNIIIDPMAPTKQNTARGGSNIVSTPSEVRHESERLLLPVMGIENVVSMPSVTVDAQGESIEVDPEKIPVIKYNANPLRSCDYCYLASRCPAFKENATCAFELPIEIRTKDQLQSALRGLLEMQVGRVMFARFAEELEGQGLDPALSEEIDRMFKLVEKFKDISDTRETVRFEMEAKASGGVLSRLFGSRAGESLRMLDGGGMNAQQSDQFYDNVIDVDGQ